MEMCVDCVSGVPDWDKLQHLLELMRTKVGVGWVELGLGTC